MTIPFPEELAMFAASGKQLDDLLDIVWSYGAAEYKRGIEDAARICDATPPYPFRPSIEAAHAIRKLGEK